METSEMIETESQDVFASFDDEGELTAVDAFALPVATGDYVRRRTGNFAGLSDAAIVTLVGLYD